MSHSHLTLYTVTGAGYRFYSGLFRIIVPAIMLLISPIAMAQEGDSSSFRIDSIAIDNRNIFNADSAPYRHWVFRLANNLHIRTKKFVIERELLQKKGDIFSPELAYEAERNLRSLPYIWDARVTLQQVGDSVNIMNVTTFDRWTLTGGPSVSRLSGQLVYEIGFEEQNLLGYGQYLSANFYLREYDPDYAVLSFTERRLLGSRYLLSLYYNDDPEIGLKTISIQKPLYALSSRHAYGIAAADIDRIDRYYSQGQIIAQHRTSGKELDLTFLRQTGTYHSKIRTGLDYMYREVTVSDREGGGINFPRDSSFHRLTGQLGFRHIRYIRTYRIKGYLRGEDIPLVREPVLRIGVAVDGRDGRVLYRTLAFSYGLSAYWKSNLVFLDLERKYWYEGDRDFRKQLFISIKYYNNRQQWITPVLHVLYAEDLREDHGRALYIGENGGLRGYPKNYREGERLLRINAESRIFTPLSVLKVDLGVVPFVDWAQVWSRNDRFAWKNMLWGAGIGLRLGMEKVSSPELFRIDLAYAGELKSWQLSFGLGQYIK